MFALRTLSRAFVVLAVGVALYDLVYQWVVKAQMKIRTVSEFWADITGSSVHPSLGGMLSPGLYEKMLNTPTPIVLAIIAGVFYLAFRALLFVTGKDKGVRIN